MAVVLSLPGLMAIAPAPVYIGEITLVEAVTLPVTLAPVVVKSTTSALFAAMLTVLLAAL
jgi:hypothetical protein